MSSENSSIAKSRPKAAAATVSFSQKYFASRHFDEVFQGGMALVEETAAYLEGPGRSEAKKLGPDLAFAYATESMHLTTRLMQLASWLLIRRAVMEGTMTADQGARETRALKLKSTTDLECSADFEQLPATFRTLVLRSLKLFERILCMERILEDKRQLQHKNTLNGVLDQHDELACAFHGRGSTHHP